MSLLDVRDLTVAFDTPAGRVDAVRGISFAVASGTTLAIVGESGSGKSVAMQSLLGLTRGAHVRGTALFEGRDLLTMGGRELRAVRGARIGMIFQDPHTSLHPMHTVGWQIAEAICVHQPLPARAARARVMELLTLVGIDDAERRVDDYPHQFSGGMLQRVMIAMAVAHNPRVLIADEPTTALDVTVQADILALLRRLQSAFGMAIILITHDLGVVAQVADDVMVMYGGRTMEYAPTHAVLRAAGHPYTKGLLASLPRVESPNARLTPIRGQPPSPLAMPPGCPFQPRCDAAIDACSDMPPLAEVQGMSDHRAACWLTR